jgi:hypothetical protein
VKVRSTNYELRITNYEWRITGYRLRTLGAAGVPALTRLAEARHPFPQAGEGKAGVGDRAFRTDCRAQVRKVISGFFGLRWCVRACGYQLPHKYVAGLMMAPLRSDGARWTTFSIRKSNDGERTNRRRTPDQRTTDNGQRTTDNGQRTTDNGQRTTDTGHRTTDNQSSSFLPPPIPCSISTT